MRLLWWQLRRDRINLPVWIVATALLAYASAKGVPAEAPTDAVRAGVLKLAVATPSIIAIRGVPDGPTLGSYVYFQVFCYVAIMAALMTTFLVTRHARGDEERGRLELLGAAPVSRTSALAATLALGVGANLVLGVGVALGLIGGNLDPSGSWAAGLAAAAVGIAFVGIAAVVSQLAPTSRSANGISAAVIGVAFLLRAMGDALGTPRADGLSLTSNWLSWISPIGWGQQVFAFTRQDLTPLLLALGLAVVTAGAALVIQSRRDLGSSILRERSGRAKGAPGLRSSFALAWRQQWPSLVGWAVVGALLGSLAGTLGGRVAESADAAGPIQDLLKTFTGGEGSLVDLLVVAIIGIAGVLGAAAGAQAIMRARGEESDGRVELVLAAPVRRASWLLGYVLVAVLSAAAVALATGIVTGLSFLSAADAGDRFWTSLAAGVAQLPAALAFIALTTMVFVLLPRLTIAAGWTFIAVGVLIGQFGGILQLPGWVHDASPFTHSPVIPGPDPDWSGAIVLLAISVVVIALSALLIRRRQLTT
jgi:ABC-2 type transport system permease protein